MSLGKMNNFLSIIEKVYATDDEGFNNQTERTIKTVRCYHEGRHGSVRWANLAAFSEATDRFVFRIIPDFEVTTDYIFECDGQRFSPLSIENVRGRGMYIEALAQKVVPTSG